MQFPTNGSLNFRPKVQRNIHEQTQFPTHVSLNFVLYKKFKETSMNKNLFKQMARSLNLRPKNQRTTHEETQFPTNGSLNFVLDKKLVFSQASLTYCLLVSPKGVVAVRILVAVFIAENDVQTHARRQKKSPERALRMHQIANLAADDGF